MERLLIVGAGGFGRSVAEAVLATSRYALVGFLDDRWPDVEPVWGHPVLGKTQIAQFAAHADAAIVALGDNERRRQLCEAVLASGMQLANVIHPAAVVSPSAKLGRGVTVMAGAVIGCEAKLGDGALVNTGAIVDHHAEVQDFGHLGAGSCLAGGAILGENSRLLQRVSLKPGERSPPNTTINALAI